MTARRARPELEHSLRLENRKIVYILANGNCLFRSLSYCLYFTESKHTEIRRNIQQELLSLLNDDKYNSIWDCEETQSMTLSSEDLVFADTIKKAYLYGDAMEPSMTSASVRKNMISYANSMMEPALPTDDSDTRLAKYGGGLDMLIFSKLYRKTIWRLQKNEEEFRWYIASKCDSDEFVTVFYTWSGGSGRGNHYDAIVPLDLPVGSSSQIPPSSNIAYFHDKIVALDGN